MASELLKNRALIQKLKEPEIPKVNFGLDEVDVEFVLPESKPQELLDIQEDVRIQRQEDTMDKARPFLMDESVDFIERKEFFKGSRGKEFADLPQEILDRLLPIEGTDIFTKSNQNKKVDLTQTGKNLLKNFENLITYYNTNNIPTPSRVDIFNLAGANQIAENRGGVKTPIYNNVTNVAIKAGQPFRDAAKNLISDSEKINNYINNVMLDPKADWRQFKNPVGHLNKIFNYGVGAIARMVKAGKIPAFKENKKLFDSLSRVTFTEKFEGGSRLKTIEDVIEYIDARPPANSLGFSKNTFDKFIMESAYRNFKAANAAGVDPKVRFIGNPAFQDFKDWKFVYKGETFQLNPTEAELTDREMRKNALPDSARKINDLNVDISVGKQKYGKIFPSVFKAYEDLEKYKNTKIGNKTITRLFQENKYANDPRPVKEKKGIMFRSDVEVDHFKGILESPFDNIRLIDSDLNKRAGILFREFRDGRLPEAEYKAELDRIGYNKTYNNIDEFIEQRKNIVGTKPEIAKQNLTAFQKLIRGSGANVGIDPVLATKAGFEEFVKPAAKIGLRGATGAADLLLSAGAGPIGLGIGALIETGQAMPELTKGNIKEAGRQTIIGSLLPESLVGSMRGDLLKLAETPEEKIGMQNFIDFKNDEDRYNKSLANYEYLANNPFEAEGIDLDSMRKNLLELRRDLEGRRSSVYNPEMENIIVNLTQRLDEQNVKNLEGILGMIVGRRGIKDRDDIQQDILRETVTGNEPIFGQAPVQMLPEEIDEIYESGIMAMANGGRIGFADGPMDPKRRLFLKIMGGIASLPIFSKFLGKSEVAKPIVKVAGSSTKMPDWFPDMINKVMFGGTGKKVDADLTIYEPKELPGITIGRHDDGRVFVEGTNEYGKGYKIEYEPPGYELLDEKTGKSVQTRGEFIAEEEVPVNVDPDGNADFDVEVLEDLDQIMGSDTRRMEEFATGKKVKQVKQGEYDIGVAEARAEQAADEAAELEAFDEID